MTIEISNSDIANILKTEAKNRNITISEYILSLVLKERDFKKAQTEIDNMQEEFAAYKNGNINLEDANEILQGL